MVPLYIHIVVKGLWQYGYLDPTLFVNINILTNDAQELTPSKFLNSSPTQTESEKILSMLRFEPGSLGQMTDALANSATLFKFLKL